MDNLFDDAGYRAVRNALEDMLRARPGRIMNEFAAPVGAA